MAIGEAREVKKVKQEVRAREASVWKVRDEQGERARQAEGQKTGQKAGDEDGARKRQGQGQSA
jgi:DNA polymerase II large subunit